MDVQLLLFYGFSAVLIIAALRVVTAKNPVHAALFLVLSFFTASGLWMLLRAEFLAIVLVLVYAGAVMVLFLFVVMMLNVDVEALRVGFWKNLPVAAVVAVGMVAELAAIFWARSKGTVFPLPPASTVSNSHQLGLALYTKYIYPFEIAAVLLLVAVIAAVALTTRRRQEKKYMSADAQARVKRADRIRLVSMPPTRP